MLVAVCDQPLGTSTPSWRKIVVPFSFPISAVRFSHSTMSNAEVLPSVKRRSNTNPLPTPASPARVPLSTALPFSAGFTVAICPSAQWVPSTEATLLFYYYRWGLAGARSALRAVRGTHSSQNAFSLRIEIRSPHFLMQNAKAGPSLLILEGLHGSRLTAHPGTASVVFFLFWYLVATWFLSRSFPRIRKTSPGATTSPQSQRSAVSTSVKFLSRGKR